MKKYKYQKMAAEKFGVEDTIRMKVKDPRRRYYEWLTKWLFGVQPKYAVHKCPFYQIMAWGSLALIVFFIPWLIFKLIYYTILKPVFWIFPSLFLKFENSDIRGAVPESVFAIALLVLVAMIIASFYSAAWLYIGTLIMCIFAIPWWVVEIIWWAITWFILTAIPVAASAIWTALVWVVGIIAAIPWLIIVKITGAIIGVVLVFLIILWIVYRVSKFLFSLGCFSWLIKTVCKIRDGFAERAALKKAKALEEALKQREAYKKKQLEGDEGPRFNIDPYVDKYLKPIGRLIAGLCIGIFTVCSWIVVNIIIGSFKFIGGFFLILWTLFTETVGNHCPPIDFIEDCDKIGKMGELTYSYIEGYDFHLEVNGARYFFPNDLLNARMRKLAGKEAHFIGTVNLSETDRNSDFRYHGRNGIAVDSITSLRRVIKKSKKKE
jgi:hypothetical protein